MSNVYYYTKALGLVELTEEEAKAKTKFTEFHQTPELAYVFYYKRELAHRTENLSVREYHTEKARKSLMDLNDKFDYLKDMFPEEFI